LFADLVAIAGMADNGSVLEVGCGTGQATRSLARLGCSVTAVEPGVGMAALARQRLADVGNVNVDRSTFEEWDDRGRRFDVLVAASAWHWVDPSVGWQRAHEVLNPGGWMALLGHVVVRRPGEPEVYAETADLSGSTGTALLISFARHRCTAGSSPTSVSPCSTRSLNASAPGWTIEHHVAT
jgi:SAM-dependent methyltransferase